MIDTNHQCHNYYSMLTVNLHIDGFSFFTQYTIHVARDYQTGNREHTIKPES